MAQTVKRENETGDDEVPPLVDEIYDGVEN